MPGKYGTVLDYIRAYDRYGGKPPIPEDAPVRRGENRSRKTQIIGMTLTLLTFGGLFALGLSAPSGPIPASVVMFLAGVSAVCLDLSVVGAVLDWYDDTPRRGLESVDQEYGLLPASPGGAE